MSGSRKTKNFWILKKSHYLEGQNNKGLSLYNYLLELFFNIDGEDDESNEENTVNSEKIMKLK